MPYQEALTKVVDEIKLDEGFVGMQYEDHLGFPTIGYGTKLPLTEEEAELLLRHRLHKMVKELQRHKAFVDRLPLDAKLILLNMAYQLGVPRLLGFKKMWRALEDEDFKTAADEMRDSLWAKIQTPKRADRLASIMSDVQYA